jgi:hypothetical protein
MTDRSSGYPVLVIALVLAALGLGIAGCNVGGGNWSFNIYIPLGIGDSAGIFDFFETWFSNNNPFIPFITGNTTTQ